MTRRTTCFTVVWVAFSFFVYACSESNGVVGFDASNDGNDTQDSAMMDAAAVDADVSNFDASADASLDARDASDAATGATLLVAKFDAVERLFESAFFGVNQDGSLHIEAHGGGSSDCPTMESADPDRLLSLGNVSATNGSREQLAVLFDFEGALTQEPLLRSTSGTLDITEQQTKTFVRARANIVFDGGTIEGALRATYCASLDE